MWNVETTDWDDKTVHSVIRLAEGTRAVIARLDHVEDLLYLGVEIHALTAQANDPPYKSGSRRGLPRTATSSTRASSAKSSRSSIQPSSSQQSCASSSRPRSPAMEPSSSQSSYTPASTDASSQLSSPARPPPGHADPVAGPSGAARSSVPQAARTPTPPPGMSARAAGKRHAVALSEERVEKKVKRERSTSSELEFVPMHVPTQSGGPDEPIDVDAWAGNV